MHGLMSIKLHLLVSCHQLCQLVGREGSFKDVISTAEDVSRGMWSNSRYFPDTVCSRDHTVIVENHRNLLKVASRIQ
jgi:hypothetical protein